MPFELSSVCQETGLVWPSLPSYEDWADLGPRIASVQNVSRWALADWLCTGEDLFQAKADQVISSLGLAYHTLENLRWVARRVPPVVRRPLPVTFSHHALVATLPAVKQAVLLLEAYDKGWTRDEFRDYLVDHQIVGGFASPREDWRQEAARSIERRLIDWYDGSDMTLPLSHTDRLIWHKEREALAMDLVHILEKYRR